MKGVHWRISRQKTPRRWSRGKPTEKKITSGCDWKDGSATTAHLVLIFKAGGVAKGPHSNKKPGDLHGELAPRALIGRWQSGRSARGARGAPPPAICITAPARAGEKRVCFWICGGGGVERTAETAAPGTAARDGCVGRNSGPRPSPPAPEGILECQGLF